MPGITLIEGIQLSLVCGSIIIVVVMVALAISNYTEFQNTDTNNKIINVIVWLSFFITAILLLTSMLLGLAAENKFQKEEKRKIFKQRYHHFLYAFLVFLFLSIIIIRVVESNENYDLILFSPI